MTPPEHDPSIEHEPYRMQDRHEPDPSEPKVAGQLDAEHARHDPAEERARHSVFDELAILPGRRPVTIDQDWYCRQCGYNLRGLQTGHPCPECGVVEKYEPPRENEETYARWEVQHAAAPTWGRFLQLLVVSVAVTIPASAICSFILVEQLQLFMFCLIGPIAAEVIKVAAAIYVATRRGRLHSSDPQILAIALSCAMGFALVQSLINLTLFHPNAPAELVAYRWTLGPVLHLLCTFLAARGLLQAQETKATPGYFSIGAKMQSHLAVAIVLHAAVNGVVFIRGYFGYGF